MRTLLCAIGVLICVFSMVLLRGSYAGELRIENTFTKADGLASDTVLAILEDSHGNMWFGTTEEVSRYDGEEWRTFTKQDGFAENIVGILFEDSCGRIWFASGELANILEKESIVDMSLVAMPLSELANMLENQTREGVIQFVRQKVSAGMKGISSGFLRPLTGSHTIPSKIYLRTNQARFGLQQGTVSASTKAKNSTISL